MHYCLNHMQTVCLICEAVLTLKTLLPRALHGLVHPVMLEDGCKVEQHGLQEPVEERRVVEPPERWGRLLIQELEHFHLGERQAETVRRGFEEDRVSVACGNKCSGVHLLEVCATRYSNSIFCWRR